MIESQLWQRIDRMPLRQTCVVPAENLRKVLTDECGEHNAHRPATRIPTRIPIAAYHMQLALPQKAGLLGKLTSGRGLYRLSQVDEPAG